MDARGFGHTTVLDEGVRADFMQSGLLDHEIEFALEYLSFTGLPDGVSPLTRVGVFDTEAFCQRYPEKAKHGQPGRVEMQIQMDERLRELQPMFPNQFIVVDTPQAAEPWPNYDSEPVEEVLKLQERLGISPERIRIYELENQNRAEIVRAMLVAEGDPGAAAQVKDAPAVHTEPGNAQSPPSDGEAADKIIVEA